MSTTIQPNPIYTDVPSAVINLYASSWKSNSGLPATLANIPPFVVVEKQPSPEFNLQFFEIKNGQIVPSSYLTGTTPKVQMTKWVLENDNLDYLKCPDELDWDTKTSCK